MMTCRLTSFAAAVSICVLSLNLLTVNAFTTSLPSRPISTKLSSSTNNQDVVDAAVVSSRSSFLQKVMKDTTIAVAASAAVLSTASASTPAATDNNNNNNSGKQLNLSDEELAKIITADMTERSFLVSADLTRSVYSESSTFQDEIDTYTIDKWIVGTQRLFVAEKSKVDLVGDVNVTPKEVTFKFREDLMFRIPFRPVVTLSGTVVLTRDEESGLIMKYREIWDQSVGDVLKTAKF